MNKKLVLILALFSALAIGAAFWQAREAAELEARLLEIDKDSQGARLVELSLPRVEAKITELLAAEQAKLLEGEPPLGNFSYPMPGGGKADFNDGFFLNTPAGLQVPAGEDALREAMKAKPILMDNINGKAINPDSPLRLPMSDARYDASTHLPVFSITQVLETDFSKPVQQNGDPSEFFSWSYDGDLVCMRSVPTSHGAAGEGFLVNVSKLAEHVLPLVEKGLLAPQLVLPVSGERANVKALPLVLRPGNDIALPDTSARKEALSGTVAAAWVISGSSIVILFGLLALYARIEKRRSDFVSAVTHELRTPLTSFTLYTEMLLNKDLSKEKADEYHQTLYRESKRLGHLVENVLAFAKLSRGKVRGRQDKGPCKKLLSEVFEKTGEHLKKSGVKFHYTIDSRSELLSLRTDLLSVEQILINLADNAIKYGECAHPSVSINTIQLHRSISIRFMDNGPGIDPRWQKDLFRPFSRSVKNSDSRKPGIGLGLALSRDLARSIGGDLILERSDSHGTTFQLTLPLGE